MQVCGHSGHPKCRRELEGWIVADPQFELMAPRSLALVNFRYRPAGMPEGAELDRLNEDLLDRLNDSGKLYLTQNRVRGQFTIRFSIGQTETRRHHVEAAWNTIQEVARSR